MTTPEEQRIYDAMGADPKPHRQNDPVYKEEIFQMMKALGQKPENLIDPEEKAEYLEWLKKNPD